MISIKQDKVPSLWYQVTHVEEWEVDWILTEENKLPGSSHMFWRKAKGRLSYTRRRKHPPPPRVWKEQVVRVLNRKAGGDIDGERNLVLLQIQE